MLKKSSGAFKENVCASVAEYEGDLINMKSS